MSTAFVHLTVSILSGRAAEVRHAISQRCLEVLREELGPAAGQLRLDITVDVRDMDRQSYAKIVLNPAS
jgi:5-carboxymethyl-2-hydroxymuconate isomerase